MSQTVTDINAQIILNEAPTTSGAAVDEFILRAETFLLSVDVTALSGTLDIKAETIDSETGSVLEVITYTTISSLPSTLLIRKAESSLDRVRVTATYSDACTFRVLAKGISLTKVKAVIVDDTTGESVEVNENGQMHVVLRGAVCTNCSTSTPLNASEVYTSPAIDILDYGIVYVNVFSDVGSADSGLSIQLSSDGTNWDNTDDYTIPASRGKSFSTQPASKYLRIVYTNGLSHQSEFRLQTILKKTNAPQSSHRTDSIIVGDDDAQLVKASLTAADSDGIFKNIGADESSNLKVKDENSDEIIAILSYIQTVIDEQKLTNVYLKAIVGDELELER